MARQPFDMLQAAFWLLAAIIFVMLGEALLAVLGCLWLTLTGQQAVGACVTAGVAQQAREIMELALTTVLALLLAGRGPPPPPPNE
jgi:hypothetical protein